MTPQELRNSVLQRAIQGKLVEQRPEEGTGEELYRQIQAEKRRLIRSGELKKEKPSPEITEDEIPFDIPDSWKWIRVSELSQLSDGKKVSGQERPYLDAKYLRGKAPAKLLSSGNFISKGTNVILVDGENSGEVFTVREDGYMCSTFKILRISSEVFEPYLLYFLLYHKKDFRNNKRGSAIPHLDKNIFFHMPMPLPPLAEQRRIVAKIEELSPHIERYAAAWERLEAFNRRFPSDMRKALLQMAIQGKLVEQRPEDGTGKMLYERIREEKRRLIQSGKLKKEKPLPEISEDEIPFDIPDSWKWVRLSSISENIGDGMHGTPEFDADGSYYFINGSNLDNGKISIKGNTQRVSEQEYRKQGQPSLTMSTILLSINGTLGKMAYYNGEPVLLGKSACFIALVPYIDKFYVNILLHSQFFRNYALSQATQTTIKNVSLKAIRHFPIPLPPLAEQRRIVAKLEELLPLCDGLD